MKPTFVVGVLFRAFDPNAGDLDSPAGPRLSLPVRRKLALFRTLHPGVIGFVFTAIFKPTTDYRLPVTTFWGSSGFSVLLR